jgi:hypothetical protein
MSLGQKVSTLIGILLHFNAQEGSRRYVASLDLNDDGVINVDDAIIVLLTPTCRRGGR